MEDVSPQSSRQEERKLIEHPEQVLSGEDGGTATQTHPEDPVLPILLIRRHCGIPASAWNSCILSTLIFFGGGFLVKFFVVGGLQIFGLVCTIATQLLLLEFLAFLADERHDSGDDQVKVHVPTMKLHPRLTD